MLDLEYNDDLRLNPEELRCEEGLIRHELQDGGKPILGAKALDLRARYRLSERK